MTKLRVTDHALVRILERIAGLDVEGLRAHIVASLERACAAAAEIDQKEFTISSNGFRYVIRNGALVTVEPYTIGRREMSREPANGQGAP